MKFMQILYEWKGPDVYFLQGLEWLSKSKYWASYGLLT